MTAPLKFLPASLLILSLLAVFPKRTEAQAITPHDFKKITFDQNLNAQINLDLSFKDEDGHTVKLGQYFGRRPIILDMGYYECPMLCSLVLNGLIQSLQSISPTAGRDFDVLCVSISPTEGPALASAKKQSYVKRYNRAGSEAGWHFLTGQETDIRALADQVGFHYQYDPTIQQYAHPSGILVITPEGKIARYFFGVTYPGDQLSQALTDAGERKVESPVRQLVILCFEHLPLIGKYSGSVMAAVRVGAVVVFLALVGSIAFMARGGRRETVPPPVDVEVPRP